MKKQAIRHLAFLHIPKAGGTTLRIILKRQFSKASIFEIGEDINRDINRFRTAPIEVLKNKKLLIGHMTHGLYHFFPSNTVCLTMLRNPIERVYSEYRFLSSNRYHPLYEIVSPLTFHQYLDIDPTRQASNGQTRLLSGSTFGDQVGIPGIEPLNRGHLDRALDHLQRYYHMVGLLERFDESLLFWRNRFRWRYPLYEKKNITKRVSKPLDKSEYAHASDKNQYDLILYKKATQIFETNYQKHSQLLNRQLATFKKVNATYQTIAGYSRTVAKKLIK